jgi:hypothetical protein
MTQQQLDLDTLVTFETASGLLGEGQLVNFGCRQDGSSIAIVVDHFAGIVRQMPLEALAPGAKDSTAPLPLLLGKHELAKPLANVHRAFPLKPNETVRFYDLVGFDTAHGRKTGNVLRFEYGQEHAIVAAPVEPGVIGIWKVPVAAMELKRRYIDGGMAGPVWTLSASEQKRFEARMRIKVVANALEKFPANVRQSVLDRASQAINMNDAPLPSLKWAVRNEPRRTVDREGLPKATSAQVARLEVVNSRGADRGIE